MFTRGTANGARGRKRSAEAVSRRRSRRHAFEPLEERQLLAIWTPQGPAPADNGQENVGAPNPVAGAIQTVAVSPSDANVVLVGGVNGGIWRTTNATAPSPTWTVPSYLNEMGEAAGFPSLSIGALEFDPTNPSHLLAGVGRYSAVSDATGARSGGARTGLLMSTDSGNTWVSLDGGGILAGKNISGVALRGSILVAAADAAETGAVGIFRSTDGGLTFTGTDGLPSGRAFDLVGDPTDPAILYTAIRDVTSNDGIYKSSDSGATWSRVSSPEINGLLTDSGPKQTSNVELAVGGDDNVYAGIVNGTLGIKKIASITLAAPTATVTSPGHGLLAGNTVLISGALQPEYNGVFTIVTATTDTFTYTLVGTPASPATGTITAVRTVTSITRPTVNVTLTSHGFVNGQTVLMSGATQPEYNGYFPITLVDANHFTYSIFGTPTTPVIGTLSAQATSLATKSTIPADTPKAVTRIVPTGGMATVALDLHGYTAGSMIRISGADQPEYNGVFAINTSPRSVSGITRIGTTATVTMPGHALSTGMPVTVAGAGQAEYNGTFTITVVDANTFTYTVTGVPATPATGAITANSPLYTFRYAITTRTVSGITRSGSTATVSMTGHSFATGASVTISGANQPEYNGTFTIAVVDPNTFTYSMTRSVTSITRSGSTATVASNGHGFSTGQSIAISGADQPEFNGTFTITVVDANTFTYTVTPRAVTSITRSGSVATVTMPGHAYLNGASVTIAGATQTEYNGTFTITVTGVDTFTYTVTGTPATPATGTITAISATTPATGTITAITPTTPPATGTITAIAPATGTITASRVALVRNGSTARVTFPGHGYVGGQTILVSGATQSEYNGAFVISNVTTDTFEYGVPDSPATPATGTISTQPYGISRNGATAIVSLPGHGYITGDLILIVISGANQPEYNGTYTITVPTDNTSTFTYTLTGRSVSSITRIGSTATVTMSNHGFANGATGFISGANQPEYNGTFTITVVDANTFTYTVTGTPASPATGAMTATGWPATPATGRITVGRAVGGITRVGSTATVTMNGHRFLSGNSVSISGAVQPQYNGTFTITVVGPDTFTYTVSGTPISPATGTIIANSRTVSDAGTQREVTPPVTLSPTASVTMNAHGFATGDSVFVTGANRPEYNGNFTITVDGANTFTYPLTSSIGITRSGTTATVTMNGHGLSSGATVLIGGADQPQYNGVKTITGVTTNTFTYTVTGSPAPTATGLITVAPTRTVTSIARSGSTATVTMSNHGFSSGMSVSINGANQPEYNGTFTITFVNANIFTYTVTGTPVTPATGLISAISPGTIMSVTAPKLAAVYRSGDGGGSWTRLDQPPAIHLDNLAAKTAATGDIHFSIAADPRPGNEFLVYIGGDYQTTGYAGTLYRGDASLPPGSQWTAITSATAPPIGTGAPHAGSREIVLYRNDHNGNLIEMIETDDGGIYRRTVPQGAGTWSAMNGNLQVAEFVDIAYDSRSSRIIGGAAGLGTVEQVVAGTIWQSVATGTANGVRTGAAVTVDDVWTVTSITRIGSTATATMPNHPFSTGAQVTISGADQAQYNGTFTITVVNANTFTYTVSGTPATPATGTITAMGNSFRYSSDPYLANFRRGVYNAAGTQVGLFTFPTLTVDPATTPLSRPLVPRAFTTIKTNAVEANRLLIAGANALYESIDGGATLKELIDGSGGAIVVNGDAIAYGGGRSGGTNADYLYVGSGNKVYYRSGAYPQSLTAVTVGTATIIDVTINPYDNLNAYAMDAAGHVWQTTNGGGVWLDITGDLPLRAGVARMVSSVVGAGATATVTLNNHGFTTGASVHISGADQFQYNGLFTITVTSANTFTYTMSGTPATPATGVINAVLAPQLQSIEFAGTADPADLSKTYGLLVVGGQGGVYASPSFSSTDGYNAGRWFNLASGLPNAPVFDLDYYPGPLQPVGTPAQDVLVAGTLGRGAWTLSGVRDEGAIVLNPVTPASGLVTTEIGGTAILTLRLGTKPKAPVTIALSSSDTNEGTLSASSVTFDPVTWNVLQTITVTGVDDFIDDGDMLYKIVTAPAVSTDPTYNGLNPIDAWVRNTDDDTAGLVFDPVSVETSEDETEATFTVVLSSQPVGIATVTIPFSSSNPLEGTVLTPSRVFTTANWNVPQTVTVRGVDDTIVDGPQAYAIVTGAAISTDPVFSGRDFADEPAVNMDNEGGFFFDRTSGLLTSESGGTDTFSVRLPSPPTDPVTVSFTSLDISEGLPNPASLVFNPTGWNVPQTVTLRGVDDDVDDGDVAYQVVGMGNSADTRFNVATPTVNAVNADNDTAGFIVNPTANLTTTEAGGTATFTVRLASRPLANVTFAMSSTNTAEGVLATSSLTIIPSEWNKPELHTVTITGVDDDVDDGDIAYQILLTATSADASYNGVLPPVGVANIDNDAAGFTINPTSGLQTTEMFDTDTFTVRLNSRPTADVTMGISSSDNTEGTSSPATLIFHPGRGRLFPPVPGDWNVDQTVTVTGADDQDDDDDQAYKIVTGAATSADPRYSGVNPVDVNVTNADNDTAGVTVSRTSVTTSEDGWTDSFTVKLDTRPTASVTIGLASSDTTEATVLSSLVFTSANWNTPQTVIVSGKNDSEADGDMPFSIRLGNALNHPVSTDSKYSALTLSPIAGINQDNDAPARFIFSRTGGMETSESGSTTTFTVRLSGAPTGNVTLGLGSSDATEGTVSDSSSSSSLVFTTLDWNIPQRVTVTGVDDIELDGPIAYQVVTGVGAGGDPNFTDPVDLSVTNLDNDSASVVVSPLTGLVTSEAGASATFTMRLSNPPTANVTIGLSSSDLTEGALANPVSSITRTGTTATATSNAHGLSTLDLVRISGADQPEYNGLFVIALQTRTVSSITRSGTTATVSENAHGFSNGATVRISGANQPEYNGVFTITVVDVNTFTYTVTPRTVTGITSSDSMATVTMPGHAYLTGMQVTISGANQPEYNGTFPITVVNANTFTYTVSGTPATPATGTITAISATTPATGTINAANGDTFTYAVSGAPVSPATGAITAALQRTTFNSVNWNTPRTVTVAGVDDLMDDGDVNFTIVTTLAGSADPKWNGVDVPNVAGTNLDNDTAGVTVNPTSGLTTTEAATDPRHTATFTVVLNTQPVGTYVNVNLNSNDITEGTLSAPTLRFDKNNWNVPQTVTVTGVDDFDLDGNQAYRIYSSGTTSDRSDYAGHPVPDVSLTNIDDERAAVIFGLPPGGLTTSESAGKATFTARLGSKPSANVTFTLASSDTSEGTVSAVRMIFTPATWNVLQTATITGVDDDEADGDISYTILTGDCTSNDAAYRNLPVDDLPVVNLDNDTLGILPFDFPDLETDESGDSARFVVHLGSRPSADVTVDFTSDDTTEGVVATPRLVFTTLNWSTGQTVTVTGVPDEIDDDDVQYTINGLGSSSDSNYNIAMNPSVIVVNLDDADTAGILVVPLPPIPLITTESGDQAFFTVVLTSEPMTDVVIPLATVETVASITRVGTTATVTSNGHGLSAGDMTVISGADQPAYNGTFTITAVTANTFTYTVTGTPATPATGTITASNAMEGSLAKPVSSITRSGSTATVTSNGHGLSAGDRIVISGANQPAYNGIFTITAVTANTFFYAVSGTPASPATGTIKGTLAGIGFSSANWKVLRTVTVTGVDDYIVDPPAPYLVQLGPAQAPGDIHYPNLPAQKVSLTNKNFVPVATDDTYTTPFDTPLVVADPGVLGNDTHGDRGRLTAELISRPDFGTLVSFSPNGGFTYLPETHFGGEVQFTYKVSDPQGESDIRLGTVTISVGSAAEQLTMELPSRLWEGQRTVVGAGKVTIPTARDSNLTVYLISKDQSEITLPETVTILAGQTEVRFDITLVDDLLDDPVQDGTQQVKLSAGAAGYWNAKATIEVGDNELAGFVIDTIVSPQMAGEPFLVNIWALEINGELISVYSAPPVVTASAGGVALPLVPPPPTVVFDQGHATFAVKLPPATGAQLTVSDGQGHSTPSNVFDVIPGDVVYFKWSEIPSPQVVDASFPVEVGAYDKNGYPAVSYTAPLALSAWVNTDRPPSIVISEISDKTSPDFVELQNVGAGQVNTWNWQLVLNDPTKGVTAYYTPRDLSDVVAIAPAGLVAVTDNPSANPAQANYYFGENIFWGQETGKGWAMLVDQNRTLVDFVAWGYSSGELEQVAIPLEGSAVVSVGSSWIGDGAVYNATPDQSLQRVGYRDQDYAGEFVWLPVQGSLPEQNVYIAPAFLAGRHPVDVSFSMTPGFVAGKWTGTATVSQTAQGVYLEGLDTIGFNLADSRTFGAVPPTATTIADGPGLLDPATSVFYTRYSNTSGAADAAFGYGQPGAGWIPLVGDWNGDGRDTVGMYDPAAAGFYLTNSPTGGMADVMFGFGQPGSNWIPIVGNWDGIGGDSVGLYDPQWATFYLINQNRAGYADTAFGYGQWSSGWTPVTGDYDGDGKDTIGLYMPSASVFMLRNQNATGFADITVAFGQGGIGWRPVMGDWNGDRKDTIGLYDPTTGIFYERNANTTGVADLTFGFGETNKGWIPLAGDWNGPLALEAVGAAATDTAPSLASAELAPTIAAALADWNRLALDPQLAQRLASVQFLVVDLPGSEVGLADGDRVYLDRNAAGHGWFLDPTPAADEEFSPPEELRAVDSAAVDRIDLVTVVAHELGHVAGLEHLDSGLMQASLPTGVRRLPGLAELDALFADGLSGDEG